jgi:hypothetical protein
LKNNILNFKIIIIIIITLISSAYDKCKPLNEMILSAKGEDKI